MKKEIWQEDQPVLRDDLILAQSSKEDAIKDRQLDTFKYGIVSDSQFLAELIPFEITVNTIPYSVDIGTGVAYSPAGERIVIDSALAYDSAAPTTLTDDGITGTTLTPQSTGSISVPLTASNVNYIYISYLQTIDSSVFTLQNTTNKRLFTNGGDGYLVEVVADAGPAVGDPDLFKPNANAVFLGVVDLAQILTLTDRHVYNLKQNNLLATVPDPLNTLNALAEPYAANQLVSHDDHVRAVGTGTVTPINPHGLAITDLTGSFAGKTSELHEKLFHESGISGDQTSLASGLYGFAVDSAGAPIAPTYARDNFIIKKLLSTEAVQINGVTVSSVDLTQDFLFYFVDISGNFLDNGTYTIYLDSLTKTLKLAANGSPTNTAYRVYGVTSGTFTNLNTLPIASVTALASNFLLWEVVWDSSGAGLGNDNFTSVIDKRYFGTIGNSTLRRDVATDTVTLDHNVTINGNFDLNGVETVVPVSPGANALVVRDSADTLDAVTISENGIVFPDGNVQSVAADTRHYATLSIPSANSFYSFTVTAGAFTPPLPGSLTVVPAIETSFASANSSAPGGAASTFGFFSQPGAPFGGTNPVPGIYLNVNIGDKIDGQVQANTAGGGSGSGVLILIAITKE